MSSKEIRVGSVSKINAETIGTSHGLNEIKYLDTGSITKNIISNIQSIRVGIDDLPSRAQRKINDKTIIYSTVRPLQCHYGFLQDPPKNLIVSTGFTTIDVIDDGVDPQYLYYYLTQKNITEYLHGIASNNVSSYPSINPDDLANLKFQIPSDIGIQREIANTLSNFDNKIALNLIINKKLAQIASDVFDFWFHQFDFPNENGLPYKSSGGLMEWNQDIKRHIPVGWGSILVKDLLLGESASIKIPTSEISGSGAIPVIDQSEDFIAGYTENSNSRIRVSGAKIVFGDHTRKLKLINFDFSRGADGTQILTSNCDRMPQHLLYMMLNSVDLSAYGYARHFKFLKDSRIVLPELQISKKYEMFCEKIYREISNNFFQNRKLSDLRDWMAPLILNGQVSLLN